MLLLEGEAMWQTAVVIAWLYIHLYCAVEGSMKLYDHRSDLRQRLKDPRETYMLIGPMAGVVGFASIIWFLLTRSVLAAEIAVAVTAMVIWYAISRLWELLVYLLILMTVGLITVFITELQHDGGSFVWALLIGFGSMITFMTGWPQYMVRWRKKRRHTT